MESILKRAGRVYRRGWGELASRALTRVRGELYTYQDKLEPAFEERWAFISAALAAQPGSLLDVGSNLGAFTARAALDGYFSVGVEKLPDAVSRATQRYKNVAQCAFMQAELDLSLCHALPQFDAILLLSVHHHWHQTFGPEVAADMLKVIVEKATRTVIFEGPSRVGRYEHTFPSFIDNDDASVTSYYQEYLSRTVGGLVSEIRPLGKTPCVGEREPFRWMYALVR